MIKLLREVFGTDSGALSMMRVAAFIVVSNLMFVWTMLCLRTNTFIPLDFNTALTIIGVLGAKAYQRKFEQTSKCVEKEDDSVSE